ncbi:6-phosphogluconate dehydrogenase [Lutibacter sp. Hel_I_33_5]|uniref:6-phosphogluconate dehydrogenase n=1 Tax=Lutibacter sp. Hel_I_33_5 TaxID=1566289 RepID=UPI0011A31710|nr:6-phosphogluconate dehydrogenase [Lutibacter sp. Hel_I_33_5]
MKKILAIILTTIFIVAALYYAFVYYVPYSEGVRSGELIKISKKGLLIKTWEGEISQGVSGAQIFKFSIEDKEEIVIKNMQLFQGRYVKVTYKERFGSLFWLGDTNYFITKIEEEQSPHFRGVQKND